MLVVADWSVDGILGLDFLRLKLKKKYTEVCQVEKAVMSVQR